jgi:hypothetical protein
MPIRSTPRPLIANLNWQVHAVLLTDLIARYSSHSPTIRTHDSIFRRYVTTSLDFFVNSPRLVAIEWPPLVIRRESWRSEYLNALDRLAANSGLDRLAQPARSSASGRKEGHALLHRSFWQRALAARNGLNLRAGDCILMSASTHGTEPDLSPSGPNPSIHVSLDTTWNMTTESIHDVRDRMIRAAAQQITHQTAAIAESAETAGYTFANPVRSDRDVDFLFWRLTEKMSYQQIATRWNVENPRSHRMSKDSVRKAIGRIADHIGIDIARK